MFQRVTVGQVEENLDCGDLAAVVVLSPCSLRLRFGGAFNPTKENQYLLF